MLPTGPISLQPKIQPLRYGNAIAPAVEKKAAAAITNLGVAEKLFKFFRNAGDVRVGGLSLEDVAARLLTVVGIYLPQGYISFKENKHVWETNGRNAVVWLMTVAVTALSKSEKLGLNKFLDRLFLQPKQELGAEAGFIKKALNKLRLDLDYYEILEMASGKKIPPGDRKNAFWAGLDANKISEVDVLQEKLLARKDALNEVESKILKAIPGFQKRLNAARLLATGIITAATVYLIGGVAMKIVYKFIAPFDHDYVPEGAAAARSKAAPPRRVREISLHQPSAFQSFAAGRIAETAARFRGAKGVEEAQPHV